MSVYLAARKSELAHLCGGTQVATGSLERWAMRKGSWMAILGMLLTQGWARAEAPPEPDKYYIAQDIDPEAASSYRLKRVAYLGGIALTVTGGLTAMLGAPGRDQQTGQDYRARPALLEVGAGMAAVGIAAWVYGAHNADALKPRSGQTIVEVDRAHYEYERGRLKRNEGLRLLAGGTVLLGLSGWALHGLITSFNEQCPPGHCTDDAGTGMAAMGLMMAMAAGTGAIGYGTYEIASGEHLMGRSGFGFSVSPVREAGQSSVTGWVGGLQMAWK
jgi:hypothetical protein